MKPDARVLRAALQSPHIDGGQVTFFWKGTRPPQLMGDFTEWERGRPVDMVSAGRSLWVYQVDLPLDTYMEYSYIDGDIRIADPLNRNLTPDGFGNKNNYYYMPQAAPTDLTRRLPGVKHGSVRSYAIKTWNLVVGKARQVHLYQPAASEPCPLLVVWDGKEYLRRAKLPLIVDNLVHQGRIRPVALAMIENSQAGRAVEYSCSESTLVFLSDLVLPIARQELNLIDNTSQPGAYAVMGASMGGLIALYTGLRLPDIFGHVISQSGAFVLDRHEMVVFDLVSQTSPGDLNIWMDIGIFDIETLLKANRRMVPLLSNRGYQVTYREYHGGHNYPAWRDDLWRGLEHHFGERKSLVPDTAF